MEVFSTRFADDAREGFIAADVSPNVLPKFLEDKCGSCKVEGGKVGVGEDVLATSSFGNPRLRPPIPTTSSTKSCSKPASLPKSSNSYQAHLQRPSNEGGAPGRLPLIAVKLNGETAKTKLSKGRYSTWLQTSFVNKPRGKPYYFHDPGASLGSCCEIEYNSSTNLAPKRKKFGSSAAASISACQAFLPWPSIVAAMS